MRLKQPLYTYNHSRHPRHIDGMSSHPAKSAHIGAYRSASLECWESVTLLSKICLPPIRLLTRVGREAVPHAPHRLPSCGRAV
jgi:hypothetical protein